MLGAALSGLGEVYIRTNRTQQGQQSIDDAVKANPAQAAFYLRNEAILFLQTGHAAEQATIDPKTQKLVLPAGCAEALQKYLELDPAGPYANDDKGLLTAAGVAIKTGKK